MKLSNRLEALFQLIPENAKLVDIGTDHGLLLIRAVLSKRAVHAYGIDINQGPLDQAYDNVVRYDVESKITLILANGLQGFNEDADCFVLAGMGAETIWEIMKVYPFKPDDTLIVQSNTKHAWFRKTVTENGFRIIDEVFMIDKGIPVFMIVLKRGSQSLSEEEALLGPVLMHAISQPYHDYLVEQYQHYNTIKHNGSHLNEIYEVLEKAVGKGSSYE